jgi:hypothetical protein
MGIKSFYQRLPVIRDLYRLFNAVNELTAIQRSLAFALKSQAQLTIADHDPRAREAQSLTPYECSVYSQNGEDGILAEILRRIGVSNRVFLEIGAGDGLENCTAFLLMQGWSGFWLDGSDAFVQSLAIAKPETQARVMCHVAILTRENVGSVLASLRVPKEFDVLSIDIDHNTYYIWKATGEWRPRVVVVEYNAFIPAHLDWKVAYAPDVGWDRTHNFGASLKALELLGREMGYSLVGCDLTGANAFFVRDDLVDSSFAEPFTAEHHYQPYRPWLSTGRFFKARILDDCRDSPHT